MFVRDKGLIENKMQRHFWKQRLQWHVGWDARSEK